MYEIDYVTKPRSDAGLKEVLNIWYVKGYVLVQCIEYRDKWMFILLLRRD